MVLSAARLHRCVCSAHHPLIVLGRDDGFGMYFRKPKSNIQLLLQLEYMTVQVRVVLGKMLLDGVLDDDMAWQEVVADGSGSGTAAVDCAGLDKIGKR